VKKFQINEKQRTVILVLLIIFAIIFILWTKNQYSVNFTESF